MKETSKAEPRRTNTWLYNKIFQGNGIDIGCGDDLLKKESFPNIESVIAFDQAQGDANNIDQYFQTVKQFLNNHKTRWICSNDCT